MKSSTLLFAILAVLICGVLPAEADTFTVVNTSFGTGTALLDNATNLEWLDLTVTSNQSYDSVEANLGTEGVYAGWSYATPQQLAQFFTDFDGGVVDNTLALELMNDLGGPLGTFYNPDNGFTRESSAGLMDVPFGLGHALYGYIAVDDFFGPSIDPGLYGSQDDWFATPIYGSWLVQPVPEPKSIALLAAGLIFLALLSRRRHAQSAPEPGAFDSSC